MLWSMAQAAKFSTVKRQSGVVATGLSSDRTPAQPGYPALSYENRRWLRGLELDFGRIEGCDPRRDSGS